MELEPSDWGDLFSAISNLEAWFYAIPISAAIYAICSFCDYIKGGSWKR